MQSQLSDEEIYCLGLIAEECAEVIQLIGKALRFGMDANGSEKPPYYGQNARQLLPKEMGDAVAAMMFACEHGLFHEMDIEDYSLKKFTKLMDPNQVDANGFPLAPQPNSTEQLFNSDGSMSDAGGRYYR